MADERISTEQLSNFGINSNITELAKIPFTQSSFRVTANFTGKKYVCIIAINNAMVASKAACSDGITRDDTPPHLINLHIKNARWSESLFCHGREAWLFKSDLTKVNLLGEKNVVCDVLQKHMAKTYSG